MFVKWLIIPQRRMINVLVLEISQLVFLLDDEAGNMHFNN